MSDDLYDSLEDECKDDRGSSNSLDIIQTKSVSVKRVSKLESINGLSSFCSGKNLNEETDLFPSTKAVSVNASQRSNFLPTITNKNQMPGLQELFNHSADFETLAKKGLLLNRDGSFTKSASDIEELPFITREYKNLVFQKRKMYNLKKQNSLIKTLKTKPLNEKETSNCNRRCSKFLGNKKCVDTLHRKSSFEEKNLNFDKNSGTNLTDSMKRVLLQNKDPRIRQQSEKTDAKQNAKLCISETGTLKDRLPRRVESRTNDLKLFNKQLPQFSQNIQKQRLTYLERHQLRNGYSPLFLRHGIKKITSDTTRSNFGDSVAGKLSDMSSRVLSVEDITDSEAEEKFYKEIIERDKNKTVKARRSNVVVRLASEDIAYGNVIESGSLKDLEKLRGSQRSSYKQISKPLSIDIKHDGEHATKKCSHYCSKNLSPEMSKIELALKGKSYGYMANARNIFKFKSRAEEKGSSKESLNSKFNGHKQASEITLHTKGYIKKSLPTLNLAKKVRSGLERSYGRRLYEGGLRNAEAYTIDENQKSFCLPHVSTSEHRNCKINSKKLMRINSCLYCPGYKHEDQISVH